jgi:hypothetical protein
MQKVAQHAVILAHRPMTKLACVCPLQAMTRFTALVSKEIRQAVKWPQSLPQLKLKLVWYKDCTVQWQSRKEGNDSGRKK